jgi:hypothetical protein
MWEELYVRRYESKATSAAHAGSREVSFALLSHVEYKNALESLYKEILRFQITSYCNSADDSGFRRLGRDVVRWDDWDKLLDDVRERERVFKDISHVMRDMKYDEECAAADQRHRESKLRWDTIEADVEGLRQAVEDAQIDRKRAQLLSWLCDIDPSEMYNAAREMHRTSTGDWLIKCNDQFREWEEQPASFFWLHGKGKAVYQNFCLVLFKW